MVNRGTKGVTLMEVMLIVVIFSLIALGMSVFLKNIFTSSSHALTEMKLNQNLRSALSIISKDFEKAAAHTMASRLFNGGFEFPNTNTPPTPHGWGPDSVPAGRVKYFSNSGDPTIVKSGRGSIQLTSYDATDPYLDSSEGDDDLKIPMKYGCTYLISGWVRTSTATSQVRGQITLRKNGFQLSPGATDTTDLSNWAWLRFSYTPPLGEDGSLAFVRLIADGPPANGIGAGTVLFDDISVAVYSSLASPYAAEVDYLLSNDTTLARGGFHFSYWRRATLLDALPSLSMIRYHIDPENNLIREILNGFNGTTWIVSESAVLAPNIRTLVINPFGSDVNFDGQVNGTDKTAVNSKYDSTTGLTYKSLTWEPRYDLNGDWIIDANDEIIVDNDISASGPNEGIDSVNVTLELNEMSYQTDRISKVRSNIYLLNP